LGGALFTHSESVIPSYFSYIGNIDAFPFMNLAKTSLTDKKTNQKKGGD
jgi:hypothetical protein